MDKFIRYYYIRKIYKDITGEDFNVDKKTPEISNWIKTFNKN